MGSKLPTPTVRDLAMEVFPLQMKIRDEGMFKYLIKPDDMNCIAEYADMVKDQLLKKLPKGPSENPIYFEIVNGEVALPGVIIAGNDRQTPEPENSQQEEIHTSVSDDNHEDDDNASTSRYAWKTTITRKMLSILVVEDKKTASDKDCILMKKLWADVAKCIAKDISGPTPSVTQCREKFYSLKRGY